MNVVETALPGVVLIEPKVFGDARGLFFESFNEARFAPVLGPDIRFVQDNQSRSSRGVLRGLHYQLRQTQGKLVRVVHGRIFDVAVDLRRHSPHFGRWAGFELSQENRRMAWLPPGFAHGFLCLSETAEVLYKASDYYAPEWERTVLWNDPQLGIDWPLEALAGAPPVLSDKDRAGLPFGQAPVFD